MVNDLLIEKLARLSRLRFSEEEAIVLKEELEKMIGFISKLDEIDTTGVSPLLYMNDEVDIMRKDTTGSMLSRDEVFANAPLHDDQFFKVPKVIEKRKKKEN